VTYIVTYISVTYRIYIYINRETEKWIDREYPHIRGDRRMHEERDEGIGKVKVADGASARR
jgi:hypothetical protein